MDKSELILWEKKKRNWLLAAKRVIKKGKATVIKKGKIRANKKRKSTRKKS